MLTTTVLRAIRERFHPMFHIRKLSLARRGIKVLDGPVWLSIPQINFRVRGRRITHGLTFAAVGFTQETNPQALALACIAQLDIASFWDVGANIGYYTWLLKSAAPQLRAVMYEPLEQNVKLIRDTLARNQKSCFNIELVAAAVSDQSGSATLFANTVGGATSSLESSAKTFEERHWGVKAALQPTLLVSLDTEQERQGASAVDFIKIDVEGHEAAVLRGAQETIARSQPILFVECGHPARSCLQHLVSDHAYTLVDGDRLSRDLHGSTNFFCFPKRFQGRIDSVLEEARRPSK
jgi:FkbM family methyltransferase